MASRRAFAALGCLQCRSRVLSAIASNPHSLLRTPALATTATLRPRNLHRAFSSLPPDTSKTPDESASTAPEAESQTEEPTDESKNESTEENKTGDETPWFLQVEPPRHAPTQHVSPLPDLPDSPPPILEPLMKYVYEEMGLDDLSLLDLRALDPPPALGPNLLMLFATARSERHLHVSSSRLVKWLRHTHRIETSADGLIGPGELKTKLRRMRRKAKLLGSSSMVTKGGDDGISTGWICCNLGTLGAKYGEAARYDAEGKMSGFGAPVAGTGSTIVVQVMTEARRTELDLERLWSQQLIRSEAQAQKIAEGNTKFHSRFGKLPPTTVRSSRGNTTSGQRREFSTSIERPPPSAQAASVDTAISETVDPESGSYGHDNETDALHQTRIHIEEIRWEGQDASVERCLRLLKSIFRTTSTDENFPQMQADLATELIQTMHERGLPVMDHETLVTIIEAIALSGARGEKMERIQSNLELVLLRTQSCPSEGQVLRLLMAYASQRNWEKFWDTWRIPPRYGVRRGPELYAFVYSQMARLGDRARCMDALRRCVEEMLAEEPPVLPTESVWRPLRACIRIADPGAEYAYRRTLSKGAEAVRMRDSDNTEFVRMLRELEALRGAA